MNKINENKNLRMIVGFVFIILGLNGSETSFSVKNKAGLKNKSFFNNQQTNSKETHTRFNFYLVCISSELYPDYFLNPLKGQNSNKISLKSFKGYNRNNLVRLKSSIKGPSNISIYLPKYSKSKIRKYLKFTILKSGKKELY